MLAEVELNDWVEVQPSEETFQKDLIFRRGQVVAKTATQGYVQLESAVITLPLGVLKVVDE